ncbi:hypothetical protein ACFPM0_28475 [Pseudonocardia sulfidoxydans]|uniref:hypothetical protein n=1 Tax=Pseudonocardia sulfidoxydans TaxID=54011 RepID=UPI003617186C
MDRRASDDCRAERGRRRQRFDFFGHGPAGHDRRRRRRHQDHSRGRGPIRRHPGRAPAAYAA